MLGGKPRNVDTEKEEKWSITRKELDAVLDFAEESHRFRGKEENRTGSSPSQE